MNKLTLLLLLMSCSALNAQNITIDGYSFESGNRGFLNRTQVVVYNADKTTQLGEAYSENDGHFEVTIPEESSYVLVANKDRFLEKEQIVSTVDKNASGKVFVKLEMKRAPGYIFDITLANERDDENIVVDAIKGADIEVFNNTKNTMELVLEDHPDPDFKVNLLKGNYYTIMIRKEGYLTKRMEAHVDIDGCILCFEGIGEVRPGVTDNLTQGNETGVLLANVEMESVSLGKEFRLDNLYYSYGKADITPQAAEELDKLIVILKDNPNIRVELGSHTDSRGTEDKNFALSRKRAKAAVDYILEKTEISPSSLAYKGYGESKLVNKCNSSADCTEEEHAINRRTEIMVLGIDPNIVVPSLAERKKEEEMERLILDLMNQEQIKVPEKESPPADTPLIKGGTEKEEGVMDIRREENRTVPSMGNMEKESNVVLEAAMEKVKVTDVMPTEESAAVTLDQAVAEQEIKRIVKSEAITKQQYSANAENLMASDHTVKQNTTKEIILDQEKAYRIENAEGKNMEKMKFDRIINPSEIPSNPSLDTEQKIIEKATSNNPADATLSGAHYSVVLHFSSDQLSQNHKLYGKHRDIKEYKTATGNYLYFLGKFAEEQDAKNYLLAQTKEDYPNAYLVKFQDGELIR